MKTGLAICLGYGAVSGSAANAPSARTVTESDGWAFELKWDGFRAIVSTENGLRFVAGAAGT